MNLFFDTSSLFKLYHLEVGSKEIINFFNSTQIDSIYISEITSIEFCSAIWKKCRKQEISEESANFLITKFESDLNKYQTVNQSITLTAAAKKLLNKHWKVGLRTLDSIQLASVLSVTDVDYFFTSDHLLAEIAKLEHLNVFN